MYLFVVRPHRVAALYERSQLNHTEIDGHERVADAVDDQHQVLHPLVEVRVELSVTRDAHHQGKGGITPESMHKTRVGAACEATWNSAGDPLK